MSSLRPSVKKQFMDRLVTRLGGKDDLSLPDGLDDFTIDKDRRVPAIPVKTARVSVYGLKQGDPEAAGDIRRPMLLTRMLMMEVRVLLQGDDDALDAFEQWITLCMSTAGRMGGLVLSLREGESTMQLLEDSGGKVLAYLSRWNVEYTTAPQDVTVTGREFTQ